MLLLAWLLARFDASSLRRLDISDVWLPAACLDTFAWRFTPFDTFAHFDASRFASAHLLGYLLASTLVSLDHWMFSCFDASWLGILYVEFLLNLVACRYSPRSCCSLRCCLLRSLVAWTLECAYCLRCSLEYFCLLT
jgi:hypothetical protein